MKWFLVWFIAFCILMWACVGVGAWLAKEDKQGQREKEECIVLKYQKEAEKFLDKDCQRYVRYKQDNK